MSEALGGLEPLTQVTATDYAFTLGLGVSLLLPTSGTHFAGLVKLVDTQDCQSRSRNTLCGFEPRSPNFYLLNSASGIP